MAFPSHRNWIGVISGMIVWAAWFVVVYGLTGVGCDAGWQQRAVPGGNLLSLLMLLATLVALAMIGWSAWRGLRGWKHGNDPAVPGAEKQQRLRFMGLVMGVLSLMAAGGTVMIAIPILMLDPCAA